MESDEDEHYIGVSQTAIYATGVGLGASKAKDINKFASDYTGYVNLVKDSVSIYLMLSPCGLS